MTRTVELRCGHSVETDGPHPLYDGLSCARNPKGAAAMWWCPACQEWRHYLDVVDQVAEGT